ncbi:12341_t:CDS:2 [Entrophospora sp. SA101]|nr:12341_t:CDS:2 [Entrophospora sp. SA101]
MLKNKIFFNLCLKIPNAEKQNDNAHRELIRSYYFFGEELEKRLTQYKDLPEHVVHRKINNEVRDQLPKEIPNPQFERKWKELEKFMTFFSLSLDNIKYVASQVRKDTGT